MPGEVEIIEFFAGAGYQVAPDALGVLKRSDPRVLDRILESLPDSILVIGKEHLPPGIQTLEETDENVRGGNGRDKNGKRVGTPRPPVVLADITANSTCTGGYEEFTGYFQDRFDSLSRILQRIGPRPIGSLRRHNTSEPVSIVGMVMEIRTTARGNKLVEIEDKTGSIPVILNGNLREEAESIVHDEVIGVTGRLNRDGSYLFTESIVRPDIPTQPRERLTGEKSEGKAVFISDIHIGSKTFLEDAWGSFLDWLKTQGDEIDYLVMGGDIVDGIGVFPNQERELEIHDIYQQYEEAARYFREIPRHIQVVIAPGNHDAVRQAEPQPRFPERIAKLFPRACLVGNPALIDLNGTRVLVYHGRSMDDMVARIPGVNYQEPTRAMQEFLIRRHLSPIYGGRVPIAPESKDHLVIKEVPDVLHCGHVHTVGVGQYRGVVLLNAGTWQNQTEFQRRMNLKPDPGKAILLDLATKMPKIISFNT